MNEANVEINTGNKSVHALTWAANGEYLVSGDERSVRMWRTEDGKEIATMGARDDINCLAVSNDGKWIAGGTWGRVFLWDAKTFKSVFDYWRNYSVYGVDFSPDSTALLVASYCTATVLDTVSPGRVRLGLRNHENRLRAAKYSPTGDRIATATEYSVRVWDSNDGQLLVEVQGGVTPDYNKGLFWVDHTRFAIASRFGIKMHEASNGSKISEWHVPKASARASDACIALPRHGEFIACSADESVTFWDTSRGTQPGRIGLGRSMSSIALSPDGGLIAMGGSDGKIVIKSLSRISSYLGRLFHEPEIHIDDAILNVWKHDRLAETEALLTSEISASHDTRHHMLACRAIVRARLDRWRAAILDAEESISIRPSIIGCVAKSIVLNGKGEKNKAYQALDVAFQYVRSIDFRFLLLAKAIIVFMAGDHEAAVSRIDDLIATGHFYSTYCTMVQAYMYFLIGLSRMESSDYKGAIKSLKRAQARLRDYVEDHLLAITLIFGWKFDNLDIAIQQRLCEALYAMGCVKEAGESLQKITNTFDKGIYTMGPLTEWLSGFTHQCLSASYRGDRAVQQVEQFDEVQLSHEIMDSLTPTMLLREWTKSTMASLTWKDALLSSRSFIVPRSSVYRVICEHLEWVAQTMEASECFCQMMNELADDMNRPDEQMKWALDFKQRCAAKLKRLGDAALSAEQNHDAIAHYSAALALNPATPQYLLIKRSKAYLGTGSWSEALDDAEKVIELNPLSPWGYERKHAALHEAGDYENAIKVFKEMLRRMLQSPDVQIREHHRNYVTPGQAMESIRRTVQDAIRDLPPVLINTHTGRLCNKTEQAAAFESILVFKNLISSMTTHIDHARIEHEVGEYYRYATFSHRWEEGEPLYEKVLHIAVHDLEESPTHDKLQMFCKIVQGSGLNWAWSDTCCIDKTDHIVRQGAVVAMFKWYGGSSLTVIFLRGVRSPSQRGDLVNSIWNSRAWTLQEYHASKVVRFYTEDWKPYLDLDVPNHKECPSIISEMEEATGISAKALMSLRPGYDDIRTKLCLASQRKTTLVEDAAYSLLGIFSVSLNVVYGNGDKPLGRLLSQLLASSGDTSILAWAGKSGSFNSCLPADISVFSRSPTTHIPLVTDDAITDKTAARLNPSLVMKFHDSLDNLPVPSFTGQRMKLPCLVFKLGHVVSHWNNEEQVFRAHPAPLGVVEIKTSEDLSKYKTLYLIHPWIDFLLNRQAVGSFSQALPEESEYIDVASSSTEVLLSSAGASVAPAAPRKSRGAWITSRLGLGLLSSEQPTTSVQGRSFDPRPPSFTSTIEKQTQARRVITRLRCPFGALLLAPNPGGVAAYRRIVTENVITVQLTEEITSTVLNKLIDSVRILDIL